MDGGCTAKVCKDSQLGSKLKVLKGGLRRVVEGYLVLLLRDDQIAVLDVFWEGQGVGGMRDIEVHICRLGV